MLTPLPTLLAWRERRHLAALRRRAATRPWTQLREAQLALSLELPASWDERAYLTCYPDVAAEVLAGNLSSGYAHWLQAGYAERRTLPHLRPGGVAHDIPRAVVGPYWDEVAYVRDNPHVAMLVALGLYGDGLAHFWAVRGQQTPALEPRATWNEAGYLWLHPDVGEAVRAGQFSDGFAHWMHHGLSEGRAVVPVGQRQPMLDGQPDQVASRGDGAPQRHADFLPQVACRAPSATAQTFAALAAHMRLLAEPNERRSNGLDLDAGGVLPEQGCTEI